MKKTDSLKSSDWLWMTSRIGMTSKASESTIQTSSVPKVSTLSKPFSPNHLRSTFLSFMIDRPHITSTSLGFTADSVDKPSTTLSQSPKVYSFDALSTIWRPTFRIPVHSTVPDKYLLMVSSGSVTRTNNYRTIISNFLTTDKLEEASATSAPILHSRSRTTMYSVKPSITEKSLEITFASTLVTTPPKDTSSLKTLYFKITPAAANISDSATTIYSVQPSNTEQLLETTSFFDDRSNVAAVASLSGVVSVTSLAVLVYKLSCSKVPTNPLGYVNLCMPCGLLKYDILDDSISRFRDACLL